MSEREEQKRKKKIWTFTVRVTYADLWCNINEFSVVMLGKHRFIILNGVHIRPPFCNFVLRTLCVCLHYQGCICCARWWWRWYDCARTLAHEWTSVKTSEQKHRFSFMFTDYAYSEYISKKNVSLRLNGIREAIRVKLIFRKVIVIEFNVTAGILPTYVDKYMYILMGRWCDNRQCVKYNKKKKSITIKWL